MTEPIAPRFRPAELEDFAARVFEVEGMPEADARCVARTLVFGNLRGLDTHGLGRIPAYLKRIRAGQINLVPRMARSSAMPFASVVDGDNAMGPVVARACIDACLASVERLGIGVATARHSNHFGAASAYTVPLTTQGCIAMAMAPGAKSLAPYGSRAPLLGTNPLAVAAPAGRYAPWSLDMAASVAARGHIRLAAQSGQSIPEGWALDAEGVPTTNPEAALRGVMLPFGGAKGSALSMMVDVLAGVLAGSGFAGTTRDWNLDFDGPADVGHFFLVMKVEAFLPLAEFDARMETAIARMKALPPAEGFDEVLYPGERAGRVQDERQHTGIPLAAPALQALRALAREQGIAFPDPL